jgi:hypothetical protein
MSDHIVRLGSQDSYKTTSLGSVAPRKFIQLTDVNMIGVQDKDLVSYDAATQTFIPTTRNAFFPDEVNLVYVSKNGNDANSGRTIQEAKLTIDAAVGIASASTVIRVSPGNYTINNPVTLPDQVSIVGSSLREVSISGQNPDDLFYVGNGNYIAEMSYVGVLTTGAAIFSFDPISVRYIDQSPYIQNCTNFVPESIGMKVDGRNAIGPIKSMVLDSYTQYNQGGIGVSITNSGYAQLVSLFTICDDIGVYCGSGGACDLTNSNSSFGNYGLVADGVSPLQFVGIVTAAESSNFDTFTVSFNQPTLNITNALYDNTTGILTAYTSVPHNFSVGMGVSLAGLAFTCSSGPGIVTYPSGNKGYLFTINSIPSLNSFTTRVGISTLSHTYVSGGTVKLNIPKPFDGQVVYFDTLYSSLNKISIVNAGDGYTSPPLITIDPPLTSWGIPASAVAEVRNGKIINIEIVSSGRGYTSTPRIAISAPNVGINTAVASIEMIPTYHPISGSTTISSGICTVTLGDVVPYEIGIGTAVYFYKQSRVLASGHSLEYIGSGTDITKALPALGGVPIQENETDARNGGLVVYTTTDQTGNFRIGDGVVINQQTGTISGRSYSKSLFSTVTPFILALGGD